MLGCSVRWGLVTECTMSTTSANVECGCWIDFVACIIIYTKVRMEVTIGIGRKWMKTPSKRSPSGWIKSPRVGDFTSLGIACSY